MQAILLYPSKASFPDDRTQSSVARYGYHRFVSALQSVGFEVKPVTIWPDSLSHGTWLFVHTSPFHPDICSEIATRYDLAAVAQAVPLLLRFPHSQEAVTKGAALSIGAEAYASWLRGETIPKNAPSYVVTSASRATACGAPVFETVNDVSMLSGGKELPILIRQCLATDVANPQALMP